MRKRSPGRELHEWDDEELLEYYEEFMQILHYGNPEGITTEDKQDFERMRSEIIYRLAQEILMDDEGA